MTDWNLTTVLGLCAHAGQIALRHFDHPTMDYKEDESVVTQADREIEEYLSQSLDRPERGSFVIGEETVFSRSTDYLAAALDETAWVIDPIDGTALYANHLRDWGVSIGFMQAGRLTEGAVYFPLSERVYITHKGSALCGHLAPTEVEPEQEGLAALPRTVRGYSRSGIIAETQGFARVNGIPFSNPMIASGSAVSPLMELAEGNIMGYVGRLKLWDVAGSLPILLNLGAIVTLDSGGRIDGQVDERIYSFEEGDESRFATRGNLVIARDERVHDYLRKSLDAVTEPA